MMSIQLALVCLALAAVAPTLIARFTPPGSPLAALRGVLRYGLIAVAVYLVFATSYVHIGPDEVGHVTKIYGGSTLKEGRIIATQGEQGPQAEILTPGFNMRFMLNVLNHVEARRVTVIPDGQVGYLVARDGAPFRPDQSFADS